MSIADRFILARSFYVLFLFNCTKESLTSPSQIRSHDTFKITIDEESDRWHILDATPGQRQSREDRKQSDDTHKSCQGLPIHAVIKLRELLKFVFEH